MGGRRRRRRSVKGGRETRKMEKEGRTNWRSNLDGDVMENKK